MRFFRSLRALALVCLATGFAAQCAIRVPDDLEKASPKEWARRDRIEGDRALQEKLEVGRQRTRERTEFHRALAKNMRANREERQQLIASQVILAGHAASAAVKSNVPPPSTTLLLGCILLGLCGVLFWRLRMHYQAAAASS